MVLSMNVEPALDRIEIVLGDITKQEVDAIVNAANSQLANGGGVAQAISLAAGPEYQRECDSFAATGVVRTGQVLTTGAGGLPCKFVINAVGPIYGRHEGAEAELLASAYRNSIKAASEHKLRSIAFCAISCGIYGYPLAEGAAIALRTTYQTLLEYEDIDFIRFCLFGPAELDAFNQAYLALNKEVGPGPVDWAASA